MSRRNWWNYTSMKLLQEMGMVHTVINYFLIARCKDCGQVVKNLPIEPGMSELAQAQVLADWRGEGYNPDKITRMMFLAVNSSRGCTCSTEDSAK